MVTEGWSWPLRTARRPGAAVRLMSRRFRLSLAQQLVLLVLGFSGLSILAVLSIMSSSYLSEVEALAQRNAQIVAHQAARAVQPAVQGMDRRAMAGVVQAGMAQPGALMMQIRLFDGEILAQVLAPAAMDTAGLEAVEPILDPQTREPVGEVMALMDAEPVRQARRSLLWMCGLLFAGCVLVVGLAGWWVARRVSAPVRELAAAVDELAQSGQARTADQGTAEIGRLQRGFNRAAEALANQRRTLEDQVRQATAELERKNAQLQAANQAKVRLLASASHDLRQPLHAMAWFAESLQSGETDPVRVERASRVRQCVDSLDRLFTGLLDLAQLDAGTVTPDCRPFPLDRLFDELSRNFRPQAEQQELRLVVRKTDAWVRTDYVMLSRVLNNLVSNALRYTCSGGVLVGARRRGDQVCIEVVDTGPGIAPEHQQRVFEEFYQVDASASRSERGLGLGLATVSRLAELLDAKLDMRSRVGRGTTLSVSLPWHGQWESGPVLADAGAGPDADTGPAPASLQGLDVLVIDDEAVILEGLGLVLRQCGARVMTALDHAQALACARLGAPDVVICDLLLSRGENGLDVLRALMRLPAWRERQPGLLLVTGETGPDRLREIAAARIPVLHKPVAPALLRSRIAELAGRAAPARETPFHVTLQTT